jgi:nicotinamidase-related amidase
MKPVLIVIDIQKDFFLINETTAQSLRNAVAVINGAITLFREKQLPVISVQHLDEEDNLVPGISGFDLPDELNILPGDLHIHKTYRNAFNKTDLAEQLLKLEANPLILAGFCAENCVLSTYRGAEDLDFNPILLQGALAGGDQDNIRFVEQISDGMSFGALAAILKTLY